MKSATVGYLVDVRIELRGAISDLTEQLLAPTTSGRWIVNCNVVIICIHLSIKTVSGESPNIPVSRGSLEARNNLLAFPRRVCEL
jgi:hypothetical protein